MAASSSSLSIVSLLLADHDHRPPSRSMDVVTNPNEFDDFGKVTCTKVRSRPTPPDLRLASLPGRLCVPLGSSPLPPRATALHPAHPPLALPCLPRCPPAHPADGPLSALCRLVLATSWEPADDLGLLGGLRVQARRLVCGSAAAAALVAIAIDPRACVRYGRPRPGRRSE